MDIDLFVWLADVEEKCAVKHHVMRCEVEEVFQNSPRIRYVEKGGREGEDVYVAEGQTDAGRFLKTYFIHKLDGSALILSARAMTARERKSYEKKQDCDKNDARPQMAKDAYLKGSQLTGTGGLLG